MQVVVRGNMKVLVAEDDIVSRVLLEVNLKKWGYYNFIVEDGRAAIEEFEKSDYDIVILDWMMPRTDGVEVCRAIRSFDLISQPYVIMLTAKSSRQDLIFALDAGANDYIVKPFNPDELLARIRVGERVVSLQKSLAHRIRELEEAQKHIHTLQGIIPICMHCHKIRNEDEIWQRLETYISAHTDAMLSHGLCPECRDKYYPDVKKHDD